jgi:hypothetical protein
LFDSCAQPDTISIDEIETINLIIPNTVFIFIPSLFSASLPTLVAAGVSFDFSLIQYYQHLPQLYDI